MHEQSKAAKRRFSDGAFHTRYFVGNGVDIGGRPDPLGQYAPVFSRMGSVSVWDLENGDAQKMAGVADASYDFVHSSHCLEHMNDVSEAMKNWVRIVKPGGFLIITVPDEDLYENGQWPSRYNSDHKWSFTIRKNNSKLPRSINVTDLLSELNHLVEIERIVLVRDFFQDALAGKMDQTLTPVAECAIEFILRKRDNPDVVGFPKVSAQTVFNNLNIVRDFALQGLADDIPHSVVIPLASYSPWRNNSNFSQAYNAAKGYTLVDQYRAYELWQLVGQVRQLDGDILEVGVWRGGSALVLGKAMQQFGDQGRLFLADTFCGVVKAGELDTAYKGGEHADTSAEIVTTLLTKQGIDNFELIQGIFPDESASPIETICLKYCHIDVDVYQSARDVFEWVWPRLVPGGVVIFDDYGFVRCEGVTRFVNELADRSDLLCIHNLNGHAVVTKRFNGNDNITTALLQATPPQTTPLRRNGFNAIKQARHGWMLYNVNDTHLGALIDTYGEFSEAEVALFQQYVKIGAVVLDCGANIGSLTLPLSKIVGETGKVIAFEPQRIQFQTLCANMAMNSVTNVMCHNQAVGDTNESLVMPPYDPYIRQSSGSSCLEGFTQGESVQQITIDSLGLTECNFIKVDVEGMEEKVLRGARQTIDRCKPILYVENDRVEKSASLETYIRELGYEIIQHRPKIVQENNFFSAPLSIFKDYVSLNILCTPICPGIESPRSTKGFTAPVESDLHLSRPQLTQSSDELYKEAVSLVNSDRFDEAVQVLEALVAKTSGDALAHNDLGVLYQKKGDLQKSRQHHQIAAQLQPANEIFQKNLADLLCSGFGELEEALSIYVQLYAQNCYDIETIKAIAHICLEVDKPDDARFFLEKILEIKPWDQEAAEALRALKANI